MLDDKSREAIEYAERVMAETPEEADLLPWLLKLHCKDCGKTYLYGGHEPEELGDAMHYRFQGKSHETHKLFPYRLYYPVPEEDLKRYATNYRT